MPHPTRIPSSPIHPPTYSTTVDGFFPIPDKNVLPLVAESYFYISYIPFQPPPDISLKLTQVLEQLKCPQKGDRTRD